MATVEFKPYTGGQIHAERTNEYITNGHGDEVLVRTNRYLNDGHGLNTGCVGVNCPSDPALASEFMEQLRAQYENNLGDRKTKGTNSDKAPVAHYQLFVSWHTDESVPPAERYEMGRELIARTKLKEHANLMAAHNNTDEDHLHISTSAFSLDGTHKLCMNNSLLYELRREMDRICVEHGYSIVEAPELWGDKAYKEWFDCVKDLDVVTVHPPLPKQGKKKTKKEQYADAKKEERELEEQRQAELSKPRKITEENRGTHFYGLPHVYDPNRPDEQLYIYALDKNGDRLPPIQLDYALQAVWAKRCGEKLDKMKDFPGKKALAMRFHWAQENAWAAFHLMGRLDIGTRAELEAHTKAVGGDISRYKQEIARQDKVIATAKETGDTAKLERAEARRERAEKLLAQRRGEYRELKHAAAVLESMDTGEHWKEFNAELMQRSTKRLQVRERTERAIRENYKDIGQLMGIPQEEIDRIITEAQLATPDDTRVVWTTFSGEMKITYVQSKSGLSCLYDYIGEQYAARRELRRAYYQWQRDFPVIGPISLILYLALAIPMTILEIKAEQQIEENIAYARRLCEEVKWHNKNAEDQLKTAKTLLAIKLLCAEGEAVHQAWREFEADCDKIMLQANDLKVKMALAVDATGVLDDFEGVYRSGVKDMRREIDKVMQHRPKTLDEKIREYQRQQAEQAAAKGYRPKKEDIER